MVEIVKLNNEQIINEIKMKNKEYIAELEKFLDTASNIQDEELQERVIFQMLKCDKVLTKMIEETI